MGSGYGGKHTGDAAVEAARLSKAAGTPVKVVWTREEEFNWAYLRPAGLMELKASVQKDGSIVGWEHHNYNSGPSGLPTPYHVANPVTQYHGSKSPLRQGSYRGLASTANHFARESFMDELAHAVNMDPLVFRQKNLTDQRLLAVLSAASEKFGWGQSKSTPTRGFGIACGQEKGGWVATCAEVAIDPATKKVKITRVVQAWECGAIVNPDGLRNQNMGAIVQGIGGALFEAILFSDGRLQNPHFESYRVPRFSDTPHVEIVLLDRKDIPSAGAGETGSSDSRSRRRQRYLRRHRIARAQHAHGPERSGARHHAVDLYFVASAPPAPISTNDRCAKGEYTSNAVQANASPKLMWCSNRNGASDHRTSIGNRNRQIIRIFCRALGACMSTAEITNARTGIRIAAVTIITVTASVALVSGDSKSSISAKFANAPA